MPIYCTDKKNNLSLHPNSTRIGDSLAQQVEHIPFKDGVLGSNPRRITHTNGKTKKTADNQSFPRRITHTNGKTKKTADNQSLSAVFLCSPTCISGQNGAIKTGEIGGLDFRQNKVHLFVSYFSDFLYFANLQLPDKTVFLHPKN